MPWKLKYYFKINIYFRIISIFMLNKTYPVSGMKSLCLSLDLNLAGGGGKKWSNCPSATQTRCNKVQTMALM